MKGRFSTGILLCTFCKRSVTFFTNNNVSRANNLFQPNKNQLAVNDHVKMISKLFVCPRLSSSNVVDPQRKLSSHYLKLFWLSLILRRSVFFLIKTLNFFCRWLIHREVLACGKIQRLPRFSHRSRVFSLDIFQ